ncbi:MAG: DUF1552 domain-containing protein [Myxococcota bacterium]|nr:DUF1552 domain-containing protein [Myxococcota bacterium]
MSKLIAAGPTARGRRIARRAFLAGAGGAAIALPLMQLVPGRSRAQLGEFPRRFVVFVRGQGTLLDAVATPGASESDFTLGEILSPLAAHRDELLIVGGLDDRSCSLDDYNAHSRNALHVLTNQRIQWNIGAGGGRSPRSAGGPSIDQEIASRPGWGDSTPHRSLHFRMGGNYTYNWRGIDQPVPGESNPAVMFDRLFAEMAMADPAEIARLRRHRRSVLDAVAGNLDHVLTKQLTREDRDKVGRHLEGVRELERTFQDGAGGAACGVPAGEFSGSLAPPERSRAHIDLLVMSLACDMTRVATISYGDFDFGWRGLRFPTGWHDAVHAGPSDPGNRAALVSSYQWYAEEFAYLLERLRSIPEGDGTMLDNTVVLYANNFSTGNNHSFSNKFYYVAGGRHMGLRGGRLLQFEGRTNADLFVSLLQVLGEEDTSFGISDYVNGPLPGVAS